MMISYYIRYKGKKIKVPEYLIEKLNYYLIECTTLEEGFKKNQKVFILGLLTDEEEQKAKNIIEDYLVGDK